MVCSAWFRERLRKVSLRIENDMVQDIDIKFKRILLFDFDGTLIETASGNTFATDLTDIKIETLKDGSIKYTSLYHESKENSDSLS